MNFIPDFEVINQSREAKTNKEKRSKKLPNIKSAKKRVDVSERNRLRNISIKTGVRTAVKKVYEAIKANEAAEKIQEAVNNAYSLIDKAVSKGVLHKNTAARKKSRLTGHVNKGDVPA